MRNGHQKISKTEWSRLGGLANSDLYRKADRRGVWSYFRVLDNRSN